MAYNLTATPGASPSCVRSNARTRQFFREGGAMTAKPRTATDFPPLVSRHGPSIYGIWFEQDPTPRFILNAEGQILESNAVGRGLITRGVVGAGGKLLCTAHRHRQNLDQALKRVAQRRPAIGRVLVRGQDHSWCIIELLGSEDMGDRIAATMRRTTELTGDHIEPISTLFGLTPVETKVLKHIVFGEPPKEVARELSMSIFTVRTHLRTIFMKMGVRGITGTLRLTLQLAL